MRVATRLKRRCFQKFGNKPKVLVLGGPTGVGKGALSLHLAKQFPGELISTDSVKIYKQCDILSNKLPYIEAQKHVPVHLINILEPTDIEWNVHKFAEHVYQLIRDISSRGKVPILTGGTMFYIDYLLKPLPEGYGNRVEEDTIDHYKSLGWDYCYKKLLQIDPEYAPQIEQNDFVRAVKAIQVYETTGKKLTSYKRNDVNWFEARKIFLTKDQKINVYRNIDLRCEKMLLTGLIPEVKRLLKITGFENSTLSKVIGIRETIQFLKESTFDKNTFLQYLDVFQSNTRTYASSQIKWCRRKDQNYWFVDANTDQDVLHSQIIEYYDCKDVYAFQKQHSAHENDLKMFLDAESYEQMRRYIPQLEYFNPKTEIGLKNIESILQQLDE
eukprot:TRINITY_DN9041_c0_g1_i1.p1 TRINITY_DN9041_c0_g1~~TRINITY_DN9041_c0_g1_i1.p1  ORF type:complete len:385 (+),score=72.71 TRINITY_DN9041_c0_g1_i1:14-1168(+)